MKIPYHEFANRMKHFKEKLNETDPQWEIAVIFTKINQYYFTGTMQDGILVIPADDDPTFWVRRSYERALEESKFKDIRHMSSFRDISQTFEKIPDTVYLETESLPLALYKRFTKYFPIKEYKKADAIIGMLRAIKSKYELRIMGKSGKIHQHILEEIVPELLYEGMSEAELGAELFKIMIDEGYHGITRFGMFDTEMLLGHIGFGDTPLYPSYFNGASGNRGLSPAAPLLGSRQRKLKKGDLVYVDIGFGIEGYHTDKTMTYIFKGEIPEKAEKAHNKCLEIQDKISKMLKPGISPAKIYKTIMDGLDDEFRKNFMGFGENQVKFLGHGIGLVIDEVPVIAEKFKDPLEENMTLAIEPKKGIQGVGMVGTENTFIVTSNGGECITGDNPGLIPVP
ncbi:MAG: aminopeptidase P family protein [Methanobacteriaceae archaeon]|nr:aminopeptidase P family protein [Methanobacteriaceae archaeon]